MSANGRSWDLKVERAEKHVEEIKTKMGDYAGKHPYRAIRVRQPKGKRDMWVYRLEMTEQPDPMIPIIIGECVHDLRSALDHLAVAMALGTGGTAPSSQLNGLTHSLTTNVARVSSPRSRESHWMPSQ